MANISVYAACTRPAAICSRTEAYRDRNGNAQIWCLAIDMLRFPYLFLLVAETRVSVLKIRTVSVRVRLGAHRAKAHVRMHFRAGQSIVSTPLGGS
jgi:hypothetical protein